MYGLRPTQPNLLPIATAQQPEAVCRAGRRDGCSRCAVRMTARGAQSRLIANVGREWPEGIPWLAFARNQGSV